MFCKKCGYKVQIASRFCRNCGHQIVLTYSEPKKRKSWITIIGIIIGTIILSFIILVIIGSLSGESSSNNQIQISQSTQEEIASSIVNIYCTSTNSNIEDSGGSGTIISEDGMILTNSHIIPQDKDNIYVDDTGCLVILPDPISGQAKEMYWANPIVLPDISDKYDLAYMSIHAAYYDEEEKKYYGTYPRKFPTFDDTTRCENENIQLGEPVRILGYPSISGGYSLTVTDGVVSSLPGDGLVVTSAKISHGNSGGIAIDRNGCMIGVPSMVNSDEYESLGLIISTDLVRSFYEEVNNLLNQ